MAININIYRNSGRWYYALWVDGEHDHNDSLDCDDSATESEAIECARMMPLRSDGDREIQRVEDDHATRP